WGERRISLFDLDDVSCGFWTLLCAGERVCFARPRTAPACRKQGAASGCASRTRTSACDAQRGRTMTGSIAIVGMACRFPDARSRSQLWENVLAQRRAFRRIPDERLRRADYLSPDPQATDSFYSANAAVIEGYEFDRLRFKVAGSTFRSADLAHWLALDVASQTFEDAGFTEAEGLPRETTG